MIEVEAIIDAAVSHAMALGVFAQVNQHEPKSPPPDGLTAGVWVDSLAPARGRSGLQATSALLVLNVRIYSNMLQTPMDEIDPRVAMALDALIGAYTADFSLDGLVWVDLLGAYGVPLSARNGYVTIDKSMYRVCDISLPLVCDDAWEQAE